MLQHSNGFAIQRHVPSLSCLGALTTHRQTCVAAGPRRAIADLEQLAASQACVHREQHQRRQMVRVRTVRRPLLVPAFTTPFVCRLSARSSGVVASDQRRPEPRLLVGREVANDGVLVFLLPLDFAQRHHGQRAPLDGPGQRCPQRGDVVVDRRSGDLARLLPSLASDWVMAIATLCPPAIDPGRGEVRQLVVEQVAEGRANHATWSQRLP